MIVIPAIDLRAGRCVRLTQGRRDSAKVYDDDPVAVAQRFTADGAEMLHVVDLDGAFREPDSPNRKVLQQIVSSIKIPVQFGGGLRTTADVAAAIDSGVQRVVLGTIAAESASLLAKILEQCGPDSIVVGIDANQGRVATHGWEAQSEMTALSLAQRVARLGVTRLVYTDIQRDGMLTGPNVEQTISLARDSGLRVIASGGVSALADLIELKDAEEYGVDSVIIGKALYEGCFTLGEAIEVTQRNS
jgi:phosphoribosylformimino-5-aminoimidazole carboxamide ribotide isomerase